MVLAVAITTAPRPRETLSRSVDSFFRAGFTGAIVVSDGPSLSRDGVSLHVNNPPLGGLKNWCCALEMLVETTDAQWLLVAEDDVLWANNAAQALYHDLEQSDPDRTGYISLYLARKVAVDIERRANWKRLKPGIYTSRLGAACWGSQAYVIPRKTAKALLADPTFDDLRRNYVKNRNRDNLVSGRLAAMGLALLYRVPCLVSHELGNANSSLGDKPIQKSLLTDYWTGEP